MNLKYTLCFLTRADQVLMLYRYNPPNQGLWNGVGGRIEAGEEPLAACLREVREETGYTLATAQFRGLLTWSGFESPDGGLYLFSATAPDGEPRPCPEGILAWQERSWLFSSPEVVSNLHHIGPQIFDNTPPKLYHFDYQAGEIVRHQTGPVPIGIQVV